MRGAEGKLFFGLSKPIAIVVPKNVRACDTPAYKFYSLDTYKDRDDEEKTQVIRWLPDFGSELVIAAPGWDRLHFSI